MCVKPPRPAQPVEELPDFMAPVTRRRLLRTGAGALAASAASPALALAQSPAFPERINRIKPYDSQGTSVVILGAAGGPDAYHMHGCSTAVVVRGQVYLVDFGIGMHRQFMLARLHPKDLRAGFLTHFHSDHMTDVYPFFSTSYYYLNPPYAKEGKQVALYGPPSASTNAAAGTNGLEPNAITLNPANPTPGFKDMMRAFVEGPYAYDNNLRIRDEGMPDLLGLAGGTPQLVLNELPAPAGAHWQNPTPTMDPVEVYEDELVRVTAILVDHPPMFPAYAFRFETPDGSITLSGDTTASENLIKLARDTDVLVHEVIHTGWLDWLVELGAPPKLLAHLLASHTPDRTVNRKDLEVDGVGTVASKAGAKRLVLNHLVPGMDFDAKGRAYDIPPKEFGKHPKREFGGPVHVGQDLLRVDL